MPKIVCPYCYNSFNSTDVKVECGNTTIGSDGDYVCPHDTNNAAFMRFWGSNIPLGHIFSPKRKFWFGAVNREQECPCCHRLNHNQFVCPHCFNRIPVEMIEEGAEVISVIGFPNSGKTNYIISLVHEMIRKLSDSQGFDIGTVPSAVYPGGREYAEYATSQRFNRMERRMFTEKALLDKTPTDESPVPLIFRLHQGRGKDIKTIYLVFYDTAGEHFTDANDMLNQDVVKYLQSSTGVIVLIDPFSIPSVTNALKERYKENNEFVSQLTQAEQMTLDQLHQALANSIAIIPGMTKKPIAFAFSKFDIILRNKDLFGINVDAFCQGAQMKNSSYIRTGKLDTADIDTASQTIEQYLKEWESGFFSHWAEQTWSHEKDNYKFFGVSSLGTMPENGAIKGTGMHGAIEPYRVMDPLVWILYKLGKFHIPTV